MLLRRLGTAQFRWEQLRREAPPTQVMLFRRLSPPAFQGLLARRLLIPVASQRPRTGLPARRGHLVRRLLTHPALRWALAGAHQLVAMPMARWPSQARAFGVPPLNSRYRDKAQIILSAMKYMPCCLGAVLWLTPRSRRVFLFFLLLLPLFLLLVLPPPPPPPPHGAHPGEPHSIKKPGEEGGNSPGRHPPKASRA